MAHWSRTSIAGDPGFAWREECFASVTSPRKEEAGKPLGVRLRLQAERMFRNSDDGVSPCHRAICTGLYPLDHLDRSEILERLRHALQLGRIEVDEYEHLKSLLGRILVDYLACPKPDFGGTDGQLLWRAGVLRLKCPQQSRASMIAQGGLFLLIFLACVIMGALLLRGGSGLEEDELTNVDCVVGVILGYIPFRAIDNHLFTGEWIWDDALAHARYWAMIIPALTVPFLALPIIGRHPFSASAWLHVAGLCGFYLAFFLVVHVFLSLFGREPYRRFSWVAFGKYAR